MKSKLNSLTVTCMIATAFGLFGCGGEADEAKKLGFASVDEMKEAHAKGWHTQQQYYKDNPEIGRKSVGKTSVDQIAKDDRGKNGDAIKAIVTPPPGEADYQLGLQYALGKGVERNVGKALELFKKSADLGNEAAKGAYKHLSENPNPPPPNNPYPTYQYGSNSTSDTSNYSNLVACVTPTSSGLAFQLASTLMQIASNNPMSFGSAINAGQFPKFCQLASGNPGSENIANGQEVAPGYFVSDRGNAAIGFVKQK